MSQCVKLCQCFHINPIFSWTFIYGESLHIRSCLRIPFSFLLKFYKPITWPGFLVLCESKIEMGGRGVCVLSEKRGGYSLIFFLNAPLKKNKRRHKLTNELLDGNGKSHVSMFWDSFQWPDLVRSEYENAQAAAVPRSLPWPFCTRVAVQVLAVLFSLRTVIHKL